MNSDRQTGMTLAEELMNEQRDHLWHHIPAVMRHAQQRVGDIGRWVLPGLPKVYDVARVLAVCRASLLMILGMATLLIGVDQGQEILRRTAENASNEPVPVIIYFVLLTFASTTLWYFSRTILGIRFPGTPWDPSDPPPHVRHAVAWVPRVIGFGVVLLASIAWMRAASVYMNGIGTRFAYWSVCLTLLFPLVYAMAVWCRRRSRLLTILVWFGYAASGIAFAVYLFGQLMPPATSPAIPAGLRAAMPIMLIAVSSFALAFVHLSLFASRRHLLKRFGRSISSVYQSFGNVWSLPRPARRIILAYFLASIGGVILFAEIPEVVAPAIGGAGLLLLWTALVAPLATLVAYFGGMTRLPLFLLLFLWGALISAWNDNHATRTVTGHPTAEPPALAVDFKSWLSGLAEENQKPQRQPVFVVAAEGGGIRAAYWTGLVLGELQDRDEKFARHLYAISGVSGGSLGALAFVSSLTRANGNPPQCDDAADGSLTGHRCVLEGFLRRDFLSPLLAAGLFPDFVQRLLPFPVESWDRARAMERSWERGWRAQTGGDEFSTPFTTLYRRSPNIPRLFLNATVADTGQRIISAPVKFDFDDALRVTVAMRAELPASTAASLSARFPYVTPAALVLRSPNQRPFRVIDGGYFENSGTETAADALHAMRPILTEYGRFFPVVIVIRNDPNVLVPKRRRPTSPAPLGELLTPVRGLFNTRDARATLARKRIERLVKSIRGGRYFELNLFERGVDLPLGWTLSRNARHEMRCQLLGDKSQCLVYGATSLFELIPTPDFIAEILGYLSSGKPSPLHGRTVKR